MPDEELLLRDLCARLPYDTIVNVDNGKYREDMKLRPCHLADFNTWYIKPYLRPLTSMTEKEAKKITELSGILTSSENILSIGVKEEFIDIKIDDGVCSTEIRTLWFTEMPTSITMFDYLNTRQFDYRGLIKKGLALEAPVGMYQ